MRAIRENAGTTVNLLEACAAHGAGLVYPSTIRAAVEPPPDVYALSKRLGETRLPPPPRARDRRPPDLGLRARPGRAGGATGAIARFAANALEGRPIVIEGDPERTRDFVYVDDVVPALEAIVRDGLLERDRSRSRAAGRPRCGGRPSSWSRPSASRVPIETPGGTLAPGENESYVGNQGGGGAATLRRPSARGGCTALCRLACLLKAAPEADQLADRLEGGPWQGIELGLNTAHVASESALARAIEVSLRALDGLDMAVTAEAPLAWPSGAFVSRRPPRRRGAHRASSAASSSRPRSARRC